jgi:hypothetical protein
VFAEEKCCCEVLNCGKKSLNLLYYFSPSRLGKIIVCFIYLCSYFVEYGENSCVVKKNRRKEWLGTFLLRKIRSTTLV